MDLFLTGSLLLLTPSAQRLVWAAKQPLGSSILAWRIPGMGVCGTRGSLRTMHGGGSAPSPTGLPSKRGPGLGSFSRADRGIGGIIHGILQARILEWVAMPFLRASSQPRGHMPNAPDSPGRPLRRTRGLDPSSKATLWVKGHCHPRASSAKTLQPFGP